MGIVKLHLGYGQRYLEGYVNIDFPVSEDTLQKDNVADLHAGILGLRYPVGSVEEIRLHHVFEHFSRPVACALLASWFSWLYPGGKPCT
jgi:predicted SAM-dependent methyltransferase